MTIAVWEAPQAPRNPENDPSSPYAELVLGWLAGKRSMHTRRAYASDIGEWLTWCAGHGIDPLAADEPAAAGWARHMDTSGRTASTAARKLSAGSSWYRWLIRNHHAHVNPFDYLDRPEVDWDTSTTPGLTKTQAEAILQAADNETGPQALRTAALVFLMMLTAARVSELTGASVEDLGYDRGHRVLWVTRKGGKRQALVLPPPVISRLDAYLGTRGDLSTTVALADQPGGRKPPHPLFATAAGRRLARQDVYDKNRLLAKKAGLPPELAKRIGSHALRHAAITGMLDAGAALRDVQDQAGHTSPQTTRRYDRGRHNPDRSPSYKLAAYLTPGGESS